LGTIARRLSGQSTEKIVENTHGNLPVARMRRRAMGDDDDRYARAGTRRQSPGSIQAATGRPLLIRTREHLITR